MEKKFCFVISPIGDPQTEKRRRADGVLDEIIRPALEPAGYTVERADHDKTPGIITETMIGKIMEADLVVADLSGLNPNVMYELAIRHACDKPFIQIIENGESLPFDIQALNTIFFMSDLAGRTKAIEDIKAAEKAVSSETNIGNPIKRTVELKALQSTGTNSEGVLANLMLEVKESLASLRAEMRHGSPSSPARRHIQELGILGSALGSSPILKALGFDFNSVRDDGDRIIAIGMVHRQLVEIPIGTRMELRSGLLEVSIKRAIDAIADEVKKIEGDL